MNDAPESRSVGTCYLCGDVLSDRMNVGPSGRGGARMRNLLCRGCGLVQQSPLPSEGYLRRYYEEDFGSDHYDRAAFEAQAERIVSKQAARLGPVLDRLFPARGVRTVDIGCGLGGLAAHCRDKYGADVVGVELNRDEAAFARERYGLEIHEAGIEDWVASAEKGAYGAIVLSHVLEHLRDPVGVLRSIGASLSPEGGLYVEVPNVMYPSKDLDLFFRIPHLWNFTPRTLAGSVSKAGLRVTQVIGARENKVGVVCAKGGIDERHGLPGYWLETYARLAAQRLKTGIRRRLRNEPNVDVKAV